jgi:hypothetical protein
MMSGLQKLIVLLIAALAFLFAVYAQSGMMWRSYQPAQIVTR